MSINTLDIENQKRSEILQELKTSTLWDIMMEEDFQEDEIREILIDFIYNHDISSTKLEEYQ